MAMSNAELSAEGRRTVAGELQHKVPRRRRSRERAEDAGSAQTGIQWMPASDRPLDAWGPIDLPFEPLPWNFADVPAIDYLGKIAKTLPDKTCMDDGTHQFTYAQLYTTTLNLANLIFDAVPAGGAVGLLMPNSIWHPVSMLACMAAGRSCVPLNFRDPPQRNMDISSDARLPVLIGYGTDTPANFARPAGLRWIDIADALSPGLQSTGQLPRVSADAPAIVLYTSGSTGYPKGIVNSQRSLLQRVQQYVNSCHLNADDVFFPLSGPATIAGCREMLTALLIGAKLYVADVESLGLRGTRKAIRAQGATIVYSVPTLLRALVTAETSDDFSSVRILRIGGEKVQWTDVNLFRGAMPPFCFIQVGYSSTETTGAQGFLPKDLTGQDAPVPVGYVLPGISVAVIGEDGAPVAPGETGELLIRSRYVALGHWKNGNIVPTRTDPKDQSLRVHATGDLVILDKSGQMRVVGRKDRQLKINGRRIEPEELEVAVRRMPQVRDAVVVVTEAKELVVFAALDPDAGDASTSAIWDVVRRTLPTPLHPTRVHLTTNIPRLQGGKVDRVSLRALDREKAEKLPAPRSPRTSEQLRTARGVVEQVWKDILNTEADGRWDEAGGDSLKLLRCVMELENLIGKDLDLKAFTVDLDVSAMIEAVADALTHVQHSRPATTSTPPLFLVPGSIGYGPSMAAFGAGLANVAKVSSIRYPDLTAILSGRSTINDMADSAMEQICRIQPDGDVRLLGYSLGGAVAFEVAAHLIAAGRNVKFFGVLDTDVGGGRNAYGETLARTLQRIRTHRVTIFRVLCRAVSKAFARADRENVLAKILQLEVWQKFPETHFMLKLETVEILRMRAFKGWAHQPKSRLPITGTLFVCNRAGLSHRLGWDNLVERLNIVPVVGGHLDLVVEPHLTINRPLIERALIETYG
jgi:acyl-coenzyme A synthetase/AMP-(fatty) acid ligase/thioesterase domain-containing protein/acyl carrier protein